MVPMVVTYLAHVIFVEQGEDCSHEFCPAFVRVEASHLTGGRYLPPRSQPLDLHVSVEVSNCVIKVEH